MEAALWTMAAMLLVLAIIHWFQNFSMGDIATRQNRIVDAIREQTKLLKDQNAQRNAQLSEITEMIGYRPALYIPPVVRFCDFCRDQYPESNHWWTARQIDIVSLTLSAYPRQKERPEDQWLHGEECVIAELTDYVAGVHRQLQRIGHKQERRYSEHDELGTERTYELEVSSCNHCKNEFSASSFWWTTSRSGMDLDIAQDLRYSSYHARDCYFCSQECVIAAVRIFVGVQLRALPQEAWEAYEQRGYESLKKHLKTSA